jgi:hypothetical protein
MIVRTFRIDGNQRYCWKPPIIVRKPNATMQPAPQDNQLMSKHRVLSFKPHLRLEWRGQDGQNETEQPDHSASLGDSITSSTRIRFSVHTGLTHAIEAAMFWSGRYSKAAALFGGLAGLFAVLAAVVAWLPKSN